MLLLSLILIEPSVLAIYSVTLTFRSKGKHPRISYTENSELYWSWCCPISWWRHQMKTFSALLALCAGNSPVPVNSPHKGQWRGALMFTLICARINDWVNNREAGDLRRHLDHYDVSVTLLSLVLSLVVFVVINVMTTRRFQYSHMYHVCCGKMQIQSASSASANLNNVVKSIERCFKPTITL